MRSIYVVVGAVVLCATALQGCGGGSSSGPYTLGGSLSGLPDSSSVTLQNNGADTLTLTANGGYAFPVALTSGSAFNVSVKSHSPGISCAVVNATGTVGSASVFNLNISCSAGTLTLMHSFDGADGEDPRGDLLLDSAGNLWGTTRTGTTSNGTVFKINAAGAFSLLYALGTGANDGSSPEAGLVQDSAGNLYGTTSFGGLSNSGEVFQLTQAGAYSSIYELNYQTGPSAQTTTSLVMDAAGVFYGTANLGGDSNRGYVFKIENGVGSVLYSFAGAPDADTPKAGLLLGNDGNLYGTTESGGAAVSSSGTVFKVTTVGVESVIHSFGQVANEGRQPNGKLIKNTQGDFFGTTTSGGTDGVGTIFKVTPAGAATVLYSFRATGGDGQTPKGALLLDSLGNLYGTTSAGGASGRGTVFKLSPAGVMTILHSFAADPDGSTPVAGLVMDSSGNLYGTTSAGGAHAKGTVFKIN